MILVKFVQEFIYTDETFVMSLGDWKLKAVLVFFCLSLSLYPFWKTNSFVSPSLMSWFSWFDIFLGSLEGGFVKVKALIFFAVWLVSNGAVL